uniref:Uncharacterized protein n=1 Tax=Dulem virus 42 TaxID=3145760 RepID=A0AAU8BAI8_9CAUD
MHEFRLTRKKEPTLPHGVTIAQRALTSLVSV